MLLYEKMNNILLDFFSSSKNYGQWRQHFVTHGTWAQDLEREVISYIIKEEFIHQSFITEFFQSIYSRLTPEDIAHIVLKWSSKNLDQFSSICAPEPYVLALYIQRGKEKLANYSHSGNLNISFSHLLRTIYEKKTHISRRQLDFFLSYPGDLTQESAAYILLYGIKHTESDLYKGLKKSPYLSSIYIEYLLEHFSDKYTVALQESIDAGLLSRRMKRVFEEFEIVLRKIKIDQALGVKDNTQSSIKI